MRCRVQSMHIFSRNRKLVMARRTGDGKERSSSWRHSDLNWIALLNRESNSLTTGALT